MEEQGSSNPELRGSRRDAPQGTWSAGHHRNAELDRAGAAKRAGRHPAVGPDDASPAVGSGCTACQISRRGYYHYRSQLPLPRCWGSRKSGGPGPERSGPRDRPGRARDNISSSAMFRPTSNTAFSWDTRRVSAFRKPSFNSNGNAFDFQGRQLSTQDFFRRVVRWEHDGTMTVIADQFEGKSLNFSQ